MPDKLRRNTMLKMLDVKETSSGQQVTFSIVFITKKGERVFLPRAVACGLSFSLTANRMRGILPVDAKGEKSGHVYPVNIDLILEFNSMEIIL